MTVRAAFAAASLLSIAVSVSAQTTTLPPELQAEWPPLGANGDGIVFFPLPTEQDSYTLNAHVQFHTVGHTVSFRWTFTAESAVFGNQIEEVSVAYEPTALAKKFGAGPSLYIAGYSERINSIIIEEWRIDDIAIASAMVQGGGTHPKSTFSKTIRKGILLISDQIGPLHSLFFNPCDGSLWMFEGLSPYRVHRLDLSDPGASPEFMFDYTSTGKAFLQDTGWAVPIMVDDEAPDSGGFVVVCHPSRVWDWEARKVPATSYNIGIMRDIGCTGSFNEVTTGTYDYLIRFRQYLEHENVYYREN